MDLVIRFMEEKDIDTIVEIENESFPTPWPKEAFQMELSDNKLAKYLVAEIEGQVVGYGGIWLIIDEGHITNIAVTGDYRGKGIGNKIVEGLITYCRVKKINNMTLEVRKSNTVAQNLYKKYGFIEYGIRPKYYLDNEEDAIIMWKTNE